MKPLTNVELESIRERCNKATVGPWFRWFVDGDISTTEDGRDSGYAVFVGRWQTEEDRIFVEHSREDIPKLLSEIDRLKSEIKLLKDK